MPGAAFYLYLQDVCGHGDKWLEINFPQTVLKLFINFLFFEGNSEVGC
jgi:hypothetical protein